MSNEHDQPFWVFTFALESESDDVVAQHVAAELLEQIMLWAEKRGLQIGGGYRKPKTEEMEPGPIFELRDEHSIDKDDKSSPGSGL